MRVRGPQWAQRILTMACRHFRVIKEDYNYQRLLNVNSKRTRIETRVPNLDEKRQEQQTSSKV